MAGTMESMPPEEAAGMPPEAPKARPWGKILAVVVALIAVVASIAVWQLGFAGRETPPQIQPAVVTSGTTGSLGSVGKAIGFGVSATGSIASYEWDFGDGQKARTTANSTSHTYEDDGAYIVLLTVRSPGGLTATNDGNLLQVTVLDDAFTPTDTGARAVTVVNPTTAILTDGRATITVNGSASHGFRNCAVACVPDTSKRTAWSWDWGDGTPTGPKSDMVHTFTAVGNYPVKLTVTVAGGATDSSVWTVRVAPAAASLVKNPGVFVIASIADPQYLDPAIDYETAGNEVLKNVYDRLVQREVTATDPANPTIRNDIFVGMAAESWTKSADELTWNFTIRTGIKWQDPTYGEMTPADVEYSLERVLMIQGGPSWIIDQHLTDYASDDPLTPQNERWDVINQSVVATDSRHVELRLARPYGAILQTLDYQVASIVSKQWILDHGGTQLLKQNAYANRNTMGSGPFILDHWIPGAEIKLVKNPNYWGTPKPRVDAVLYRLVPEPTTQELLLKNGDVDFATGIPTRDIRTVMTWDGVVVRQNPSLVVQYMGMVEDNSWPGDINRTVNTSPFQDLHVRLAVSYAFDYNLVLDEILDGWGSQLKSGIPQGMPGWDGSFWTYRTDITLARQHLAMADPRWASGGFSVNLTYNTGNPVRAAVAVMVQAQLAQLGITVNIRAISFASFLADVDRRLTELYILGWAPDYLDPDDYLFPLFHGDACPMPIPGDPTESDEGTNGVCYRNPAVDRAIDNASRTSVWQYRLENYTVAQRLIVEEAAWVYIYQPTALSPLRDWVKGFYYDPMALRDFKYIYK